MKRTNNQSQYTPEGNQRFSIVPAAAVYDERLSGPAFRTLCALGVYGDRNGWCWPSQQRLAEMLHKSRQAVSKDIQQLVEFGYVRIVPQYLEDGSRGVNRMQILFDRPPQLQVDIPSTSEVDTPATSEVATPSTSEVAVNAPFNDSFNDNARAAAPTPDPFDGMQTVIERLLGYPSTPKDIPSIQEMVELQITEADLRDALAWFKSAGKIAFGAAGILGAAKRARATRIQNENAAAAPAKPKSAATTRHERNMALLDRMEEKLNNGI